MDMIFNLFQVDELNRVHLFGFTFYMDDLIIVLLLLFFYFEHVDDSILYIALFMVLLS